MTDKERDEVAARVMGWGFISFVLFAAWLVTIYGWKILLLIGAVLVMFLTTVYYVTTIWRDLQNPTDINKAVDRAVEQVVSRRRGVN